MSVFLICAAVAYMICLKIIDHGLLYAADDIWWHVLWLKDFIAELNEGIIYPRWLAQSNYLCGSPVLVFYPPFCFYAGAIIQKVFALSVMHATTGLFFLGTFGSGYSFYLCGRRRWDVLPAAGGALMLMTAPFISFDIYFRASLPELMAMSWLPLILLSVDKVQFRQGKLALALGFWLTAMTHVPSLFIYFWSWLARLMFCTIRTNGGANRLGQNVIYAFLGIGAASFFLLPVTLEQSNVNIAAILDRLPWQWNLLYSSTYRGLFIVPDLAMKASVIAVLLFIIATIAIKSRRKSSANFKEPVYWLTLNLVTLWLMSYMSGWIWNNCKILQFLQFPWRLMTINIFCTAALFAICLQELKDARFKPYIKILISMLLLSFIVQNASTDFFITKYRAGLDKPEAYMLMDRRTIKVDEFARYSMPRLLNGADGYPGVPEYTPLVGIAGGGVARIAPRPRPAQPLLQLLSGNGVVHVTKLGSYDKLFSTEAREPLKFTVRNFYFPGWHLYVDGRENKLDQAENGLILVSAKPGMHFYELKYDDALSFKLGLGLSAISLLFLIWLQARTPSLKR